MALCFSPESANLSGWTTGGNSNVLYPLFETEDKKQRGGMFYCAPNYGPGVFPGQLQHGEWRNSSPQRCIAGVMGAVFMGDVSAEEGSAKISLQYLGGERTLVTRTTALAQRLIPMSLGFHPYFSVSEDHSYSATVDGGALVVRSVDIKEGNGYKLFIPRSEKAQILSSRAELRSLRRTITIISSVVNLPGIRIGWVVWTDNKKKYLCIEPIIVGDTSENKIIPFWLNKGSLLEWVVEIIVS